MAFSPKEKLKRLITSEFRYCATCALQLATMVNAHSIHCVDCRKNTSLEYAIEDLERLEGKISEGWWTEIQNGALGHLYDLRVKLDRADKEDKSKKRKV